MHYHLEVVVPFTETFKNNIRESLEKALAPFGPDGDICLWDYFKIGGRYSGSKLIASIPDHESRLNDFYEELKKRKITVSFIRAGKDSLEPKFQEKEVDALWQEMFPGFGDVCPIFEHAGQILPMDVCSFSKVPPCLKSNSVLILTPSLEENQERFYKPSFLIQDQVWNGVNFIKTQWNTTFSHALKLYKEKNKSFPKEIQKWMTPDETWYCITVDYHS